jgi:hypothetical protein
MAPDERSVFCAICGSSLELLESSVLRNYNLEILAKDQTEVRRDAFES